jgi:hypothetical protein
VYVARTPFHRIGKALRAQSVDILHEPKPKRWVGLIHYLDEEERSGPENLKTQKEPPERQRSGRGTDFGWCIMNNRAYCVNGVFTPSGDMSHRHCHAGVISFASGSRELECTVHNSSASLAELRAAGVESVPHRFELREWPGAPRRAVTVVWRKPGVLGVRFDEYFAAG